MYVHHLDGGLNILCFREALQKRILTRFKKKTATQVVTFTSMYYHDSHVVEIIRNAPKSAYVMRGAPLARQHLYTYIFITVVNIVCQCDGF
jgi:hypothetical protein